MKAKKLLLQVTLLFTLANISVGQSLISGRPTSSLNGKWQIIIDQLETGLSDWRCYYKNEKPTSNTSFKEYAFIDANTLNIPGDWNSQAEKLFYYEGLIWYKKDFIAEKKTSRRYFIHFGAVNYKAIVYLNGQKLGEHEGGFTPFSFEITDKMVSGSNFIVVAANNKRSPDGIPAANYDWWNYGGITRDVNLVETPETFIDRYFLQLKKGSSIELEGWVQLNGLKKEQTVSISIPDANLNLQLKTNAEGNVNFRTKATLKLWSPQSPTLYQVNLKSETDAIIENIGFRNIEVKGSDILLNGKSIFLKGICTHEEIAQRAGRAYSEMDAIQLLSQAKELGCNFVRLAHYPHNENMVRIADRMGLLVWSEIPLWQNINFKSDAVYAQAESLLTEMIARDQNRASVIIWSIANETPVKVERTEFLKKLAAKARQQDGTRLVSAAFELKNYQNGKIIINDPLGEFLDILAINEYIGWYASWQAAPEDTKWESIYNKPLIMSEFGAEALYGNHGDREVAHSWSEEFQEEFYKKQLVMLKNIPFLRGTAPWILTDFQSSNRNLPGFQDGWNRKGLLSDKGFNKKAWYLIKEFYDSK